MKLGIISDIHQDTQFNHYDHTPIEGVDVMIVAGDLQQGSGIESLVPYIQAGQRVIYVAGNHEFYDHEMTTLEKRIREHAAMAGVDFLNNDAVIIDGVRFIGGTMWTDFKLYGEAEEFFVRNACQRGMNDYYCIKRRRHNIETHNGIEDTITTFRAADAYELHQKTRSYIANVIRNDHTGPTVVVTHHSPSMMSVPIEFKADRVSGGYASHMDDFVMQYQPNLWVHGHTHTNLDYNIGDTRVVCNPRGYHFEHRHADTPYAPLLIDI